MLQYVLTSSTACVSLGRNAETILDVYNAFCYCTQQHYKHNVKYGQNTVEIHVMCFQQCPHENIPPVLAGFVLYRTKKAEYCRTNRGFNEIKIGLVGR